MTAEDDRNDATELHAACYASNPLGVHLRVDSRVLQKGPATQPERDRLTPKLADTCLVIWCVSQSIDVVIERKYTHLP